MVEIVKKPSLTLAGIFVRTDMSKSSKDCPDLWQKFVSITKDFPVESYGVSIMADNEKGTFDYWAAVTSEQNHQNTGNTEILILPAAEYAKYTVASLNDLPAAYNYMYTQWSQTVKDMEVDYSAPCFEFYDARYKNNGEFDLFIPVKRK